MGLKRVSWVRRYQGQCRALRPLGHQGCRLRNHKKDQPLCSGYICILLRFMFLYIRLVQLSAFSVSLWDLLPFWVVALVWVCLLSQKISVRCKCSAGVLVIGVKTRRIQRRRHTTTIISCCI